MKKESDFKPAWWLRNPHLQTIWPTLLRPAQKIELSLETFELSDGDFLDLAWLQEKDPSKPLVVLLHGLCGSVNSPYAMGTLRAVELAGWRGVLMHFRGCGSLHNRLHRGYHAGDTADLNEVIDFLLEKSPHAPIAAIGYSLGGNVLLKWLGETREKNPLTAAIAISVPFDLPKVVNRINRGFSRLYSHYLLQQLRDSILNKLSDTYSPVNLEKIKKAGSFQEFDTQYTAPVHGFADAFDYYQRASSRHYLKYIAKPTLILHAEDDPFMTPDAIPNEDELSEFVTLEVSRQGGHVGFISGRWPWNIEYWLENRILSFLKNHLEKTCEIAR